MGKGDSYRPVNRERFGENFEALFGKNKLNVWESPDDKEGGTEGTGDRTEQSHQPTPRGAARPVQDDPKDNSLVEEAGSNSKTNDLGGEAE